MAEQFGEKAGKPTCLDRVIEEVLDYGAEHFSMREELEELERVHDVQAVKSTILCSARILDALAAAALDHAELPKSANAFSNLELLQQYDLLPTVTRYWAHALRRIGNVVRHLHHRVQDDDAELASLFAEHCLMWFFCRFPYGRRLSSLTRDGGPLGLTRSAELRDVMETFAAGFNPRSALERAMERHEAYLRAPAFAAALAEKLIAQNNQAEAFQLLEQALERFPEDLRLRQLLGLYWSKSGQLQQAIAHLEPLYREAPQDDETIGIMAGAYKRLWRAESDTRRLLQSYEAYRRGWDRSRKTNTYLGVNAATTALWLARADDSRRIADEVLQTLRRRLESRKLREDPPLNHWDRLTLAEVYLLLDERVLARETYLAAFQARPHRVADIDVARRQAIDILKAKDMPTAAAEAWFDD
jgi:tetratricopeptide (TPR) repeat protein